MKTRFGKITFLVAVLSVILGLTLCLSSCSAAFDFVDGLISGKGQNEESQGGTLDDEVGKDDKIPEKDEDSEGDNTITDVENPDKSEDDGASDSGEIEFYPGQGSVDAENISAKNRTLLSTVIIVSYFGPSQSLGSGVIYDIDKETGDAYIITNYHVVHNRQYGVCDSAKLYLYGMQYANYAINATFVGGSSEYEIAVLKVEGSEVLKNSYAMAAEFGDSEDVRVFDEVFAVGNPEGYGMAVTEGIISVDSESLDMAGSYGTTIEIRVMRVSAAINNGNSGGGLYDANGKLIGIVVAKRIGADIDNIGYAIPSNLAKNLVDNIIYYCDGSTTTTVQRPLIGVTISAKAVGIVADEVTGEIVKAEKIEITELSDTCIAKELLREGDVVNSITVGGVTVAVTRLHHIIDHMLTARVGTEVIMNITRGGETFDVTFTVPESAFTSVK